MNSHSTKQVLVCHVFPQRYHLLGLPLHKFHLWQSQYTKDDNWVLQLLDFVIIPGNHTGERICDAFRDVIETKYNLGDIRMGVTLDNASNNNICHPTTLLVILTWNTTCFANICLMHLTTYSVSDSVSSTGFSEDLKSGPREANWGMAAS